MTRVSEGGPAEIAGLQIGDKIMQVIDVPKEENKAWARRSETLGCVSGGGEGAAPASRGTWETHQSCFGVHAGAAPEEAGSPLCVP